MERGICSYIQLIALFCLSFASFDAVALGKIEFQRSNRYTAKRVDILEIQKSNVYLNAKKSRSKAVRKQAQKIFNLSKIKSDSATCNAGEFRLIKTSPSKKTIVMGCSFGKDYGNFVLELERLHRMMGAQK